MLTKSNYIQYIQCQKLLWLYKNKKDVFPEASELDQAVFDQGYEVENWARKLFGKGKEVKNFFQKGQEETKKYVDDGEQLIFQATAMPKDLFVRADILKYNKKTKKKFGFSIITKEKTTLSIQLPPQFLRAMAL